MEIRPEISVVIPARDAAETIERCIRSLARQELEEPWEAILVDDGSVDGTAEDAAEAARASGLELRVERLPGMGPAAARNRGAELSSAPALAFLDADCFPTPAWLAAGLRALEDADLVQGRVSPDPDVVRGPFDRTLHVAGRSPLYESANLFVDRALFDRLEGFEEWLQPEVGKPVAEDVWFGWRAQRAGETIDYAPAAHAHHAVFREGAIVHVLDRRRLTHFPAIARKIPEIRPEFLFARWFLTRRTAAFDLAVAGIVTRRGVLALPYVALLLKEAAGWKELAPKVLPVRLAADLVGFWSLVRGSVKYRSAVL